MRCSIDGFYRERYSRKITCYLFPDHGIRYIRLRTLRCKYVYIPAGIFASMNPDYVAKAKELYGITGSQIAALNWGNFFTVNLLPVTIGNIIGGGFIIGGLFFYLHGKNCK